MNPLLKNVYVINLDRSQDRLIRVDTNLKSHNIQYKRFSAIDGSALPQYEINNITTPLCRYLLCNRSIVGCAMSHVRLWESISQSPDRWHLVLEDDAQFTNQTINVLRILSQSPVIDQDNIIINLKCMGFGCDGKKILVKSKDNSQIVLVESIFPLSTNAYLITKNTAKKLYDYFIRNKINYHVDFQIAWNLQKLGIKYYVVDGAIDTSVHDQSSTIGTRSLFLLSSLLETLGFKNMSTYLSTPILTLNMSVVINGYIIIFFVLLLFNILIFNSLIIYILLILELAISLLLWSCNW